MDILAVREGDRPDGMCGWRFRRADAEVLLPPGDQSRWPTQLDDWLARVGSTRLDLRFDTDDDRETFLEDFETPWYAPTWSRLDRSSQVELMRIAHAADGRVPSESLVSDLLESPGLAVKVGWDSLPGGGRNTVPAGFLRWVRNGGPGAQAAYEPPGPGDTIVG